MVLFGRLLILFVVQSCVELLTDNLDDWNNVIANFFVVFEDEGLEAES